MSYGYDRLDRRVLRRINGAEETRFEWDLANRLTAIRYAGESTLYQWDVAGRLARKTLPNGITTDYAYDISNRLLSNKLPEARWRADRKDRICIRCPRPENEQGHSRPEMLLLIPQ